MIKINGVTYVPVDEAKAFDSDDERFYKMLEEIFYDLTGFAEKESVEFLNKNIDKSYKNSMKLIKEHFPPNSTEHKLIVAMENMVEPYSELTKLYKLLKKRYLKDLYK